MASQLTTIPQLEESGRQTVRQRQDTGERNTEELQNESGKIKRGGKINERHLAAAEREEELRHNEDIGYRSQRGKSLLDIWLDEIVLIPPGKLKVIV